MTVALSAFVFAAVATVVAGAPASKTDEASQQTPVPKSQPDLLRMKRSTYGNPYVSQCGGGVPIQMASAPAYHMNVAPAHHAAFAPQGYGYGLPHYRADMLDDGEVMSFSDMEPVMAEHIPMARYAYGAAPTVVTAPHYSSGVAAAGLSGLSGVGAFSGQLVAPAAAGPAYGVFPNANVGGCSVPLLLSCSPSVVPGRIVKSHGPAAYGGGAVLATAAGAPDAYRGVDDQHRDGHEQLEDHPTAHEQMASAHDSGHMTGMHQ